MLKHYIFILLLHCSTYVTSQSSTETKQLTCSVNDSLKNNLLLKSIGSGYVPSKYFNFDLRYLIKYNQYEGIRTGIGGITNNKFSKKFRLHNYIVYGFKDHRFKYSFGGGARLFKETNTWVNINYTDDLRETGSTKYITDTRTFQFFEPRLLNIDLFHKHITKSISFEHQIASSLLSKINFSTSKISPTYNYQYTPNDIEYHNFHVSSAVLGFQWSPLTPSKKQGTNQEKTNTEFPKFSLQYTKSFKNVFKSDFNFSKLDFRTIYEIGDIKNHFAQVILVSGIAIGDTPLTHLYHAYPNNIRKETILQRFSVAGLNSFETMYFNEFFSDNFFTLQLKYALPPPFNPSNRFNPQLVLITRYALGNMGQTEQHKQKNFNTLKYGYTESGFEINKLLYGFGLSFTYRYGAYYLPHFSDNIAFKFTFNVTL